MNMSTGRDLHIDNFLTNIAINFRPQGMIADMIAPVVVVQKESDVYPIFSQAEMFAIESTLRSRGKEANKITRSVSSAQYLAKNYALARDMYIEDIANMDAAVQFEMGLGATRHILDGLRLDWERRVITQISTTTAVASVFLPSSSWVGGGDPISQVMQIMEQQMGMTGYKMNSLGFGWRAWSYFRRNANVRNLINGTNNGRGFVTRQQAQELFEVDRFWVQESFWNTANEAQSMNLVSPFADRVIAYYAPLTPSREEPSFMYSFRWQNPSLPAPMVVERHPYDSRKKIETIEAGYYQDEVITGPTFGAVLAGVGSSQANGLA
jgi:hypothetical protein